MTRPLASSPAALTATALAAALALAAPLAPAQVIDVAQGPLNAAGTQGGWMINVDRMDALPPGSAAGSLTPRHFHTAGANQTLQNADDCAHATPCRYSA